jgi:hypothetical protein
MDGERNVNPRRLILALETGAFTTRAPLGAPHQIKGGSPFARR